MKAILATTTVLGALLLAPATTSASPLDDKHYLPRFERPIDRQVVRSPVQFRVSITNGYKVEFDAACQPAGECYNQQPEARRVDAGHCHVYVEDIRNPGVTVGFNPRCRDIMIDLPNGQYCAHVDLTHDDHVVRFKPSPQLLPQSDKVCFRVVGRMGGAPPFPVRQRYPGYRN